MATQKLTEIQSTNEITSVTADDIFYLVDDPGGTPASGAVTFANLLASIDSLGTNGTPIDVQADLNLANSSSIQDAGTDAITFDGSANVTIPNGSLDVSGGSIQTSGDITSTVAASGVIDISTNNSSVNAAVASSVTNDTGLSLAMRASNSAHGGSSFGESRADLLELLGDSKTILGTTSANELNLGTNNTIAVTVDTSQNVTIPNGGLVVGSPTGGNQGTGTINATAVYDDGSLLTDYVFDAEIDGSIDIAAYDAKVPNKTRVIGQDETGEDITETVETQHGPARRFELDELDPATFASKARSLRKLPAIARYPVERMSIGEQNQALIETCEVQAIHIGKLEARLAQMESGS